MGKERFQIGEYWLDQRRGRDVWHATTYDKQARQTRRSSLGTSDFQIAKRKLAEFVVKSGSPNDEAPEDFLLATMFVRYYDQHAKSLASASVARGHLRCWTEFWGDATVADLTPRRQKEFREWLKSKGFRNAYVSRILATGRAALNWAKTNQEVKSVPVIVNVSDRSDSEDCYSPSMTEVQLLVTKAREIPHLWSFMILALCTLGRPSSILELGPNQVNLEHSFVDLNPKGRPQTKKYRATVPLPDAARAILSDTACERFVMWQGSPVKSIKKSFASVVKAARLNKAICPYSLRHAMAKALRKRKVIPWELDGMMGHRRPGPSEIYAKYDPDYCADGRKAVDAYMIELGIDLTPPACQLRATPSKGNKQHVP